MDNEPEVISEPEVPPQGDNWNPPGGEVDFDDIFGGAGDGSTDLSAKQPPAAEPVKTPSEPAAEPQVPAKTPFQLKTSTGTTYNSLEDTIKGIEEKDRNLAQLRAMVEAATGADPLKKGNYSPNSPIRYTSDSRRYAEDLTKAAEVGQKTGNWDTYRDVQAKFQLELLEQTVGPYLSTVQKVGRQEALDNVERSIPGFKKDFYNSDEYHKALEARPKLKETIEAWERQPGPAAQETLSELYGLAYDTAQARKLPDLIRSTNQPSTSTTPRMPMSSTQLTPQQPSNNQTKPGFENQASRKALMEQLERKGVKDFRF